ncbi:MAG: acyl carrier protein [Eubacteriales bacterium]
MELEFLQNISAEVLHVDSREVTPESTFQEDLGADSLDLFQIFTETEKHFGISVSDEDWQSVRTVGDAIEIIRKAEKPE